MTIKVHPLKPVEHQRWDEFVLTHPHGTPFHHTAWMRSIQETFGYSPQSLVCTEGEQIRAVLPLFLVRNMVVGKALISTPFAVYGGILADAPESREAMRAYLQQLGEDLQVDYVDLRNNHVDQCAGFENVARYVTFTQKIGTDQDEMLKVIPRKTRATVRKALAQPFSARNTSDLSRFEDLYSRNLKRLGTPSFPSAHFSALRKYFGDRVGVREVLHDGHVVAAVMSFYFRDQVVPYYGASDPAYNAQAANNYMYFDLMRWAGANGFRTFDFGRSRKESGSFAFKAHWGMEMRELPYEMFLVRRKSLPHYSPGNPRFRTAIRIWQNLPLAVTRALGPRLLPFFP